MNSSTELDFYGNSETFAPELLNCFGGSKPRTDRLWNLAYAVKEDADHYVNDLEDRTTIAFNDGDGIHTFSVQSLESIFRGDVKPPSLEKFPSSYIPFFGILEHMVINIADYFGDPTDDDMQQIYRRLRRKPDGQGVHIIHDYVWQACAIILALRPWSREQYEAVLGRLEKSCRTFSTSSCSKNYIKELRRTGYPSQNPFSL